MTAGGVQPLPPLELAELLGVEHPLIQAPMAAATTPALAGAVAAAGALGSLGCAMLEPAAVEQQVAETRGMGERPLNVNFFANQPGSVDPARDELARELVEPFYAELGLGPVPDPGGITAHFDEAMLETVLRLKPEVVSFHFGLPNADMVDALHDVGSVVLSSATTVREALRSV